MHTYHYLLSSDDGLYELHSSVGKFVIQFIFMQIMQVLPIT